MTYKAGAETQSGAVTGEPTTSAQADRSTKPDAQPLKQTNAVVAIYDSHDQAERAVKSLQRAGFNMKQLSIVGRDYHSEEHVVGYYTTGDRMMYWGGMGAFWGGLWGFLFGAAFFFIPGIGPIVVAGPLVTWIVAGLEGAAVVGGLSALGAALYGIGIPKNSILKYETALRAGKFVLVAHGAPDEVRRAKDIIETTDAAGSTLHLKVPS